MTRFAELLAALARSDVKFILIGGVAGAAHGSPRNTQDIDIVYERSMANLARIVTALEPYNPYLRDAPPRLPFRLDVGTLRAGLNFTLTTDAGWLDLFAEIPGGGTYSELLDSSIEVELFGFRCRILDLDGLIVRSAPVAPEGSRNDRGVGIDSRRHYRMLTHRPDRNLRTYPAQCVKA